MMESRLGLDGACTTVGFGTATALSKSTTSPKAITTSIANASNNTSAVLPPTCVQLLRPRVWQGGVHPTYSISIQPQPLINLDSGASSTTSTTQKQRRRVATASGDKSFGVCIWDLDELLTPDTKDAELIQAGSREIVTVDEEESKEDRHISVKLEAGLEPPAAPTDASTAPAVNRRGLLATLPHHLSAVNVVRWEPTFGKLLASGSDLHTQSVIIWSLQEKSASSLSSLDSADNGSGKNSSNTPFGLTRSTSDGPSLSTSSDTPANKENWVTRTSLHGQADIQDLAWAPVGLHFPEEDPATTGSNTQKVSGLVMDSNEGIARRLAQGIGSTVLASCSLDTTVMVWSADGASRHTLKGHSGWVVGVSFDPMGAFLAAQSSDAAVWIWSLSTFEILRKIRNAGLPPLTKPPRADLNRTVAMARMSWTPDGAALLVCRGEVAAPRQRRKETSIAVGMGMGASKGPQVRHVSVALNRKRNFSAQCVFAGHAERTTVISTNPVLFKSYVNNPNGTPNFFAVFAVGSHDCCISIWSTRRSTPILLLTEVCNDSILDLSWGADGKTLLVASHDGSILVLQIPHYVLEGLPASDAEKKERFASLYGTSDLVLGSASLLGGLIEGPEVLRARAEQAALAAKLKSLADAEQEAARKVEAAKKAREAELDEDGWGALPKHFKSRTPLAPSGSAGSVTTPANKEGILAQQTEVRRADGKRRIVPVLIATPPVPTVPLMGEHAQQLPVRRSSSSAADATKANLSVTLGALSVDTLMAFTGGDSVKKEENTSAAATPIVAASGTTPSGTVEGGAAATSGAAGNTAAESKGDDMDESTDLFGGTDASVAANAQFAARAVEKAAERARKKRQAEEAKKDGAIDLTSPPVQKKPKLGESEQVKSHGPPVVVVRAPKIRYVLPPPARTVNRWNTPLSAAASSASGSTFVTTGSSSNTTTQFEFQVSDSTGRAITAASIPSTSTSLCTIVAATRQLGGGPAAANATAGATTKQLLWECFLPHRALMSKVSASLLAVACVDTVSGLHYLSLISGVSGRQLAPPMLLPSAPFALSIQSMNTRNPSPPVTALMVLTCDGLIRVYEIILADAMSSKLRIQCSVRSLLAAPVAASSAPTAASSALDKKSTSECPRLVSARLNSSLQPVVLLSTQQTFIYHASFESWGLLQTDTSTHAATATKTKDFVASEMKSSLELFERTAAQENKKPKPAGGKASAMPLSLSSLSAIDPRTRIMQTLAQLEAVVASSVESADATRYRQTLTTYVAKLVSLYPSVQSARLKLEEVWRQLKGESEDMDRDAMEDVADEPESTEPSATHSKGPSAFTDSDHVWSPFILGISKASLVRSLLPLIRSNPALASLPTFSTESQ